MIFRLRTGFVHVGPSERASYAIDDLSQQEQYLRPYAMPRTAPEVDGSSLLAPLKYDNDASSFHSGQLSDPEDDRIVHEAQTSLELAEYDRAVLDEEEEREELLVTQNSGEGLQRIVNGGSSHGSRVRIGRRERRHERKATKRRNGGKDDEQGELMYEMEEGGQKDDASSESSCSSSELDRQKFHDVFTGRVCQTSPSLEICS